MNRDALVRSPYLTQGEGTLAFPTSGELTPGNLLGTVELYEPSASIVVQAEEQQVIRSHHLHPPKGGSPIGARSLHLDGLAIDGAVYSHTTTRSQFEAKKLDGDGFTQVADQVAIESELQAVVAVVVPEGIARSDQCTNLAW